MSILITGFGNFRSVVHNPSEQLVAGLAEYVTDRITTHVFQGGYTQIDAQLTRILAKHRPDVILMFGLANRSNHIRLERYAALPKQLQHQFSQQQYKSSLPLAEIRGALQAAGMSADYSEDAGSYYCNYLFYKVCAATAGTNTRQGFIHIPNASLYKKATSQNLDLLTAGRTIVDVLLRGD